MAKRLLAEQVEYVCAQGNLTRAKKVHMSLKRSGTATKEQIELSEVNLTKLKEKLEIAGAALKSIGLNKSSI
jgi:hypothetical protein